MAEVLQRNKQSNCNHDNCNGRPLTSELSVSDGSRNDFPSFKLFETLSNKKISGAGFRFGRFTSFDVTSFSHIKSAKITRVQSPRVISTRSWSRPSVDSIAVVSQYRETKSSIDQTYITRRNGMPGQWVDDFNALIEDNDLWFMHDGVKNDYKRTRPTSRHRYISQTARVERLNDHSKKNKAQKEKSDTAGATSVTLNVSTGIFSTFHKRTLSQVGRVCHV